MGKDYVDMRAEVSMENAEENYHFDSLFLLFFQLWRVLPYCRPEA